MRPGIFFVFYAYFRLQAVNGFQFGIESLLKKGDFRDGCIDRLINFQQIAYVISQFYGFLKLFPFGIEDMGQSGFHQSYGFEQGADGTAGAAVTIFTGTVLAGTVAALITAFITAVLIRTVAAGIRAFITAVLIWAAAASIRAFITIVFVLTFTSIIGPLIAEITVLTFKFSIRALITAIITLMFISIIEVPVVAVFAVFNYIFGIRCLIHAGSPILIYKIYFSIICGRMNKATPFVIFCNGSPNFSYDIM